MADTLSVNQMREWWDASAKGNAASAVLSSQSVWDADEFYKTGEAWALEHRTWAERHIGINGPVRLSGEGALDFGCGLGRMTRAWAPSYSNVTGIDISPEMISKAKAANPPSNVEFAVAPGYPLAFDTGSFDLTYSTIVLQHIPSPHSLHYLTELLRIVKPGGYSLLDVPVEALKPIEASAGIFTLALPLILMAARDAGCILLGSRLLGCDPVHPQMLFQQLT